MISVVPRPVAAVSLLALAACSTAQSADRGQDLESEAEVVRTQRVTRVARPLNVIASGVVDARTTVELAFQVPGKVAVVGPDEGDVVHENQLLAQLDPTDYSLALEQAAALAERSASERNRYRPLLSTGSVAPNEFERIESVARQNAAAARLARKRLSDSRLRSPISGVVARRIVEPGSSVLAGQSVFTLVDLDVVKVRIGVAESDVDRVRLGLPAVVHLPSLGAAKFAGRVTSVGVAADPVTRTYAVEISVRNPGHRLKAGMVAEATIEGKSQVAVITVPSSAIVSDAEGMSVVYVVDTLTGRVHRRRVATGATRDAGIEITEGLSNGDLVVVAGQHRLREGARVIQADAAGISEGVR
jgi:RND family efflux transporter MFP subunit